MKKFYQLIFMLGILMVSLLLSNSTGGATGADEQVYLDNRKPSGIEQVGPQWMDVDWHYRTPISITSSTTKDWYQVLIHLDKNNFEFNHSNPDGSDLRFTLVDGVTPLIYWIESWNSTDAYIWVRVSPLSSENTIYAYYGNPAATYTSDGAITFDSFDDNWSHITSIPANSFDRENKKQTIFGIESLFSWSTISGLPTVSSGNLILNPGTGIKSKLPDYLYQAVGFRANFGSANGNEWGGFIDGKGTSGTTVGDIQGDPGRLYLINSPNNNSKLGDFNWHGSLHVYEVRWVIGRTTADVDHGVATATSTIQVPNQRLPVTFYSDTGSTATLQVDWVYVRQYQYPEPSVTMGNPQGLVELGITISDSPDPLPQTKDLTYQLSVSNSSTIDAPGVVVTDTLPSSVAFISANAPLGCSHVGITVVCNLNTIAANSSANATIVVKPTTDGVIMNAASVGSPGYELNLNDNSYQVTTLVDTVPPTVEWQKPGANRSINITNGGSIILEASAYDASSGIAYVEFWRYITTGWIKIATVNLSPYQIQFNSDILVPNQLWPFEVFAFDKAGNQSSTQDEKRQVIFIERNFTYFIYLPSITK